MKKRRLVIIVGPTASGKSSLALKLAIEFNGEIISADSMQLYRLMDIGTAKPSLEERSSVPHHLIDVADPKEEYTAARFREEASQKIEEIASRGRNIFIAGGTGLYIKALTEGLFEGPQADWDFRRGLIELAADKGKAHVHALLAEADPESAAAIHPNNLHRVVRAIEVCQLAKRPVSELQREHAFSEKPFETLKIGIELDREELYARIDKRVEDMAASGLLEETKKLLSLGYSSDLKAMRSLGYKEMAGFLQGEYGFNEALRLLKKNTRHYAKRQLTWFKKDKEIFWHLPEDEKTIEERVKAFLS